MKTTDYLQDYAEQMPAWLMEYEPGTSIDFELVRKTRCAYYPGAGDDGCLLKCCNMAHCCHLFICADYAYWGNRHFCSMDSISKLKGYRVIGIVDMEDFSKRETRWHINPKRLEGGTPFKAKDYVPQFKMYIYERLPEFDDRHGAKRIAVLLACYDGIALYDILFGNKIFTDLFMVLNQEHGFGGNYSTYCSLMQGIALSSGVLPELMLTESHEHTIWKGYEKVETEPIIGGMHHNERYIYSKIIDWKSANRSTKLRAHIV